MLSTIGSYVGVTDVLDVLATSVLIYYLLLLIRGTRAVQILMGIIVLLALLGVANVLHLYLLVTILQLIVVGAAVTIPIVFQPELRRALEQIGRGGLFFRMDSAEGEDGGQGRRFDRSGARAGGVPALASAPWCPARRRTAKRPEGVLRNRHSPRRADLGRFAADDFRTGVALHDGAAIVREDRIVAAGCFLPLAERPPAVAGRIGTRHRAAVGLTEQTDAVVVVVSKRAGACASRGRESFRVRSRRSSAWPKCCWPSHARRATRASSETISSHIFVRG